MRQCLYVWLLLILQFRVWYSLTLLHLVILCDILLLLFYVDSSNQSLSGQLHELLFQDHERIIFHQRAVFAIDLMLFLLFFTAEAFDLDFDLVFSSSRIFCLDLCLFVYHYYCSEICSHKVKLYVSTACFFCFRLTCESLK